jgi:hypothetical protein
VNDGQSTSAPAFWIQYERDLIAFAMTDAWHEASYWLGYHPSPIYDVETLDLSNKKAICQTLKLEKTGWLNALGKRGAALIDADATITFSDEDGDSIDEIGSITVTLGVASIEELQVFYRVTDGAPQEADEAYEIYPVIWVDNGNGSATGSFHRGSVVLLEEWQTPYVAGDIDKRNGLPPADDSKYLTDVAVYRIYPDPTDAVQLVLPLEQGDTELSYLSMNAVITDQEDAALRLVLPDDFDECAAGPLSARKVRVYYYAGRPLHPINGRILPELETALVRFANTQAPLETKNISLRVREQWKKDWEDLFVDKNVPPEYVNPFGIKRGQWEAWRIVTRLAHPERGNVTRIS